MERTEFALGPLDVSVSDMAAQAGTLRATKNLVPISAGSAVSWQPVEGASPIGTIGGVLSFGVQVRQRRGTLSEQSDSSLVRYVALLSDRVVLYDEALDRTTDLWAFGAADATRRATFAQVGDDVVVAVVRGAGCGEPEVTLLVQDDKVCRMQIPAPPRLTLTTEAVTASDAETNKGLPWGLYAVRFAYVLTDGTMGPATTPSLIDTRDSRYQIGVTDSAVGEGAATFKTTTTAAYDAWTRGQSFDYVWLAGKRLRVAGVGVDAGKSVFTLVEGDTVPTGVVNAAGVQVSIPRRVTLTGPPPYLPQPAFEDGLAARLRAVAVVISQRLADVDELREAVYTVLGEVAVEPDPSTALIPEAGTVLKITSAPEALPPFEGEEQLSGAEIRAGTVGSYNRAVILGDVAYDYPAPVVPVFPAEGDPVTYCFDVRIETSGGAFVRRSEERIGMETMSVPDGFLSYPDARAKRLTLYVRPVGGSWSELRSYALEPCAYSNVAVSEWRGTQIDLSLESGTEYLERPVLPESADRNSGRVMVSGTNRPLDLLARRVSYVGDGPDDGVIGFASNALPISEGQFGQYPLYALCHLSVSAGQVGSGDISFASWSVVAHRGCVGRRAFCNMGREIAYASEDGVWLLAPGQAPEPLSESLVRGGQPGAATVADDDFLQALGCDTALGYFSDRRRGRRELWVSCGVLTFGWSRAAGWFVLDRARRMFARKPGVEGLSGLSTSGEIVAESGDGAAEQNVLLLTSRLHLTSVGAWKRLSKLWLRSRRALTSLTWKLYDLDPSSGIVLLASGTLASGRSEQVYLDAARLRVMARGPFLLLSGRGVPGQGIEGVGLEAEARMTHRLPELVEVAGEDIFYAPATGVGGRLVQTAMTNESVTVEASAGLAFAARQLDPITFRGVTYTDLWAVKLGPDMLGRERITTDGDTIILTTDD